MKKKIVRFAAFTLALVMLPGCGKGRTPAEPTTVNQAMLLEQSAKEQTEYTFPEKFTGDWVSQEGRLTIHADAQVVAELAALMPVRSGEREEERWGKAFVDAPIGERIVVIGTLLPWFSGRT